MLQSAVAAACVAFLTAGAASALTFESGAGDGCSSPFGGCAAGAVVITPHPAWQAPGLVPGDWISYADTGYGGAVLASPYGSPGNPLSADPLTIAPPVAPLTVTESFTAQAGSVVYLHVWADDTVRIIIDGITVQAPTLANSTCASGPIGCTPANEGLISYKLLTDGPHSITFEVYQIGSAGNTSDNPLGLLYHGSVGSMPEPGTMLLLGTGLAGSAAVAWRRRRRTQAGADGGAQSSAS
jgi:hypothetical protein